MLPGFRFLFIAVVLSVSMLVFGLGAAALLRATHEEFASLPLQQIPEVVFATREDTAPTLAMLQVDTPTADTPPTDLDRHDGPPQAMDAATTQAAPAVTAPATPEAALAPDPGTASTDAIATPSAQSPTDDKPATDATRSAQDEKTTAALTPDGGAAGPTTTAPSTPEIPKTDAATAGEATPTPAADPGRDSLSETEANATQTVAALDPAAPVAAAPESTGQPLMDAAPASTPSGDSTPDDAKVDNTKSGDTKPADTKAENATTDHSQADSATTGTAPGIAGPSSANSTAMAALEDGNNETTGHATSEPPVAVEPKAAIPDIVPQSAAADAANRPALNDAPVITAFNIHIPMPVARPKTFSKASLTVRPITRKRVARQRPVVRRAHVVRHAPPKPVDPFAGSPFSSN
ncbi:MAG: hypothetical protein J0H40_22655 [Rhizobiales bacterium]|nr:hypothetical protein [Hyphomicrobiales bacterium]